MHTLIRTPFLLTILLLQGCSLFNNGSDCDDPKVIETVKTLYINQVDPNENLVAKSQPIDHIQLINIKKIASDEQGTNTENMFKEYFSNAKHFCEALIEHPVQGKSIEKIEKSLSSEPDEYQILKNSKLYVPIIYGIRQKEGNEEVEIEYSAKNPTNLLQVMLILNTLKSEGVVQKPKEHQKAS